MATDTDVCTYLKTKTRKAHDESDRTINLKLALVLTDIRLWTNVLADFLLVFKTMEEEITRHKQHHVIQSLFDKDMFRTKAFRADIEYFLGPNWESKVEYSEAAQVYCERIALVSDEDPILLLSYGHSMYLGLLAGGQIIKKIVKRTLGLSGTQGLAIFEFPVDRVTLKNRIITNINGVNLKQDELDDIVREKIRVFQMNNDIANSVQPTWGSYRRILNFFLIVILILLLMLYLVFTYIF